MLHAAAVNLRQGCSQLGLPIGRLVVAQALCTPIAPASPPRSLNKQATYFRRQPDILLLFAIGAVLLV